MEHQRSFRKGEGKSAADAAGGGGGGKNDHAKGRGKRRGGENLNCSARFLSLLFPFPVQDRYKVCVQLCDQLLPPSEEVKTPRSIFGRSPKGRRSSGASGVPLPHHVWGRRTFSMKLGHRPPPPPPPAKKNEAEVGGRDTKKRSHLLGSIAGGSYFSFPTGRFSTAEIHKNYIKIKNA